MKPTSSKPDFKKIINDKFHDKALSERQLCDLHDVLNKTNKTDTKSISYSWYMILGVSVVMVAIFILASFPKQSIEMSQLIANEVVRNHLKTKPLNLTTSSYKEIRNHFDKLNFQPISSSNIPIASQLIGGRYCSLQGYKAALLKVKDFRTKKIDTLYQVPYVLDTFGILPNIDKNEKPIVVYDRGIKVSIWVEKGVLFARTHIE